MIEMELELFGGPWHGVTAVWFVRDGFMDDTLNLYEVVGSSAFYAGPSQYAENK